MHITVNGEVREAPQDATLADMLAAWRVPHKGVAVERNRAIVPKSAYGATVLQAGDQLEIVTFVGGG